MIKLKFPKNFKKEVYQELQKSKSMSGIYRIHSSILIIERKDLETTEKIFDRLVLNYKIV
jgi:hypothetical protein